MVLVNGFIRVVTQAESNSFDEQGNPTVIAEVLGERIPCNYVRNSYKRDNNDAGSEYESSSYTILIEPQEFHPCQYRLYDITGNELGLFEAKRRGITFLQAVRNIQITQ